MYSIGSPRLYSAELAEKGRVVTIDPYCDIMDYAPKVINKSSYLHLCTHSNIVHCVHPD